MPKATVRRGDATVRRGHPLAGARGDVDDQTRLVAVLRRWRTGNHLHRLDRIQRNLVGKNLALLIGDGLAIDRERVLGVIAQAMKKAVRVGGDAWRGERNQRAYRGGSALQRKLVEQAAVHVGVKYGRIFQKVFRPRPRLLPTGKNLQPAS